MSNSGVLNIFDYVKQENTHSDRIKIRTRPKRNGDKKVIGHSVFFDFYQRGRKRQLEYLDKTVHFDGDAFSLQSDKEKLRMIVQMRNQRQNEILKRKGFEVKDSVKKDFVSYFKENSTNDNHVYKSALLKIIKFTGTDKIDFDAVDKQFCEDFMIYLQKLYKTNSVYAYMAKLRAVLNRAVRDEIIYKNPTKGLPLKSEVAKREFLTEEEIKKLILTPKTDLNSCNAFLFSCCCGLRWSDVRKLNFSDIKEGFIDYKSQKTGRFERAKLNSTALEIVEQQKVISQNDLVFNLCHKSLSNKRLRQWMWIAGIEKHISFHCARHTFATLALSNDVDIYSVSKLLGHSNVTTTQIYAKIIDKKLESAVQKLPVFDVTPTNLKNGDAK